MGLMKRYLFASSQAQKNEGQKVSEFLTEYWNYHNREKDPKMSFTTDAEFSEYLLEQDANKWRDCEKCSLCWQRKEIVYGYGNPAAKLVLIVDYPEAICEKTGEIFVNTKSAVIIKRLMKKAGISFSDCYFLASVLCKPATGSKPESDESEACSSRVFGQIDIIKPEVILLLGESSARLNKYRDNGRMKGLVDKKNWPSFKAESHCVLKAAYSVFHPRALIGAKVGVEKKRRAINALLNIFLEIEGVLNGE